MGLQQGVTLVEPLITIDSGTETIGQRSYKESRSYELVK